MNRDALRATAAMIQTRWPGRWEGDLARRLEQLTTRIQEQEKPMTDQECTASTSGHCLAESQSETACDTDAGECVHGGKPATDRAAPRDGRATCPDREPLLGVQCVKEAGHEVHSDRPGRIWYPAPDEAALRDRITAIHQPVAGEGGTQWCQVCSQEEIQPQPVGWWVPWPCPTMQAVAEAGRCSGEEGFCAEHGYHRHSPQQPEGRDLSDPPLYGAAESETRPEMNAVPLAGEELTADEAVGEPLLLCCHTEPGSPCDWDVCRQPERLAASDHGTDPGARHLGH